MSETTLSASSSFSFPTLRPAFVGKAHRLRTFGVTLTSDLLALLGAALSVHFLLQTPGAWMSSEQALLIGVMLAQFWATNLYPGMGLNPAQEMKTLTKLSLMAGMIVFAFGWFSPLIDKLQVKEIALTTAAAIPCLLAARWAGRIMAVQAHLWGEPVALIGHPESLADMDSFFQCRRRLGFLPVICLPSQAASPSEKQWLSWPLDFFSQRGIQTALVSARAMSDPQGAELRQALLARFQRLVFISEMDWMDGSSVVYHDLEGVLGMEARRSFLPFWGQIFKRAFDIGLALTAGALLTPVLLLTAILIRLESPGPVLYTQPRVGKNGRLFRVFKFRSMHVNADAVLQTYLQANPQARAEWQETQKLRHDPRITRVGCWIRKFSIDELPQLWNILTGDMSAVGPRPILPEQKNLYGKTLETYTSLRPGLTGFWQVSGRNKTSFQQRVLFDQYYVRNWSGWLDIYILLRTVWVVLSREGAY